MSKGILVFSDAHWRPGMTEREKESFRWVFELGVEKRVSKIVSCGDLHDSDSVGNRLFTPGQVKKDLIDLIPYGCPEIIAIDGNHDRKSATRGSALFLYGDDSRITPVLTPQLKILDDIGINLVLFPWRYMMDELDGDVNSSRISEFEKVIRERFYTLLGMCNENYPKILSCHCRVFDTWLGASKFSAAGVEDFVVGKDILEMFDYLVLGDSHKRQEVVTGRGGFVGSLDRNGFDEEDNIVGAEYLRFEGDKIISEFIENPNAKTYKTITLTEKPRNFKFPDADNVKFKYHEDSSNTSKLIREFLDSLSSSGHKFEVSKTTEDKRVGRVEEEAVTSTNIDSPSSILDLYAKATNMESEIKESLANELQLLLEKNKL